MIRLAIIEDNAEYRRDLIKFLESSGEMHCVCECGTAQEAVQRVPSCAADVVLMDLELPGRSGIECIRDLKPRLGDRPVLVLTVHQDNELIFQALSAGARGYCLKRHVPLRLRVAIRDLYAGQGHLSPEVARSIAEFHHEPVPAERLTPAEARTLELLKTSLSLNGIAEVVGLKLDTVTTHKKHIYQKLGVHSRAELCQRFGIKFDRE